MKGKKTWNKGVSCSDETKKKISEAKSMQVLQIDISTGEVVRIWDKTSDVIEGGFSKYCVQKCCDGKNKQHKGYRWQRPS